MARAPTNLPPHVAASVVAPQPDRHSPACSRRFQPKHPFTTIRSAFDVFIAATIKRFACLSVPLVPALVATLIFAFFPIVLRPPPTVPPSLFLPPASHPTPDRVPQFIANVSAGNFAKPLKTVRERVDFWIGCCENSVLPAGT